MATVRDTDMARGGKDVTDGLTKVLEVLGDKINQCESSERWVASQKSDLEKQYNKVLEENRQLHIEVDDLRQQCFEANEKVREYESMMAVTNDGKVVRIVDLPEMNTSEELVDALSASLDHGNTPGKAGE